MFNELRQIFAKVSQTKMQANRMGTMAKEGSKALKGDKNAMRSVAARQGLSVPQGMVPKGMKIPGRGGDAGSGGAAGAAGAGEGVTQLETPGTPVDRAPAVRPSEMRKG